VSQARDDNRAREPRDATLILAAQRGDDTAFSRLFRRHADAVRTRLTRLVGPVAERDDLVQRVFLAFHRALPSYRGEGSVSTYLHRVAVNAAYDYLRSHKRQGATISPRALEDLESAREGWRAAIDRGGPPPEAQVQARADLVQLLGLLDQLSPKKRIAFVLVAVEGCSQAEAGALLGVTEETVKQRVRYARRELLQRMSRGRQEDA
jgi:RNA polymerase sigma-70 factor (ECF subfamily)